VRRINSEGALLLGGGRALLMQIAHPLVARGVAEHSDFEADRVGRLLRTLRPVYAISFGTAAQAGEAAARVRARHGAVTGPGYQANDPDLLLWVHATLIDSALRSYRTFVGDLAPADAARYYEESATFAELFGVPPDRLPPTLEDFDAYVARMVATLEVTDEARHIAHTIFALPSWRSPSRSSLWLAPALFVSREVTAGLLPPRLREQYRMPFGPVRARTLAAAARLSRLVVPRLPRSWRAPPRPLLPPGVRI
jgi:uncharacterized protein (DUF2236 family)